MTNFNWIINQMDSLTANGFVVRVHYTVIATDETYSTSIYGTTDYTQTQGQTYIPYENLTESIVASWVQESLGKDAIETSMQNQIDALKNPVQQSGLPWAS
jgi:hypothetical protein